MRCWFYVLSWLVLSVMPAQAQSVPAADGVPTLDDILQRYTPETDAENNNNNTATSPNPTENESAAEDVLEIPDGGMKTDETSVFDEPISGSPYGNDELPTTAADGELQEQQEQEAATESEPEETIDDADIEIQLDVFEPDFMNSLMNCQPNTETKDGIALIIVGNYEGKCRLTYGNYELNLPLSILNNIHSFDELDKNERYINFKNGLFDLIKSVSSMRNFADGP